jgi:regulator of RNase E activity RraA
MTDERAELLAMFDGLRVTDVRDGMDYNMLHHQGSMSPSIRPLWRTRVVGIAKTARYLPYGEPVPHLTPDEYLEWVRWYYREICPYPWRDSLQPGDFVVLDQSRLDAGLMGSNNSLNFTKSGVVGFVTNGGVRDTDELILQKIPFWSAFVSQSMVQGRVQYDAHDIPVEVGGVRVHPGDVVVADGDGVIVVPRDKARDVAKYARRELTKDKQGRRKLYEALGMALDDSVK